MSLEDEVGRIATALERIATAAEGGDVQPAATTAAPAPAAKKTAAKKGGKKKEDTPPPAAEGGVTEDDLRLVFQEFVGKKGSDEGTAKLKELIGSFGASKIGDIKPENYAEIVEAVKSWK